MFYHRLRWLAANLEQPNHAIPFDLLFWHKICATAGGNISWWGENVLLLITSPRRHWNEKQYRFSFLSFLHFSLLSFASSSEGMPMNQMPCLQVDGKRVNQSLACCRYLARDMGLAGADDWENLQIDTVADTVNDFRLSKNRLDLRAQPCHIEFSSRNRRRVLRARRWGQAEETRHAQLGSHSVLSREIGGHCTRQQRTFGGWKSKNFRSPSAWLST